MAVVPAAPLLVPGVARDVPPALAPILSDCDHVVSQLVASAAEVVVVAGRDVTRDLNPSPGDAPVTGWRVGDNLLDRVGFRGVRVRVTPAAPPRPDAAMMFLADGSASAGPKPPRPAPGGAEFDRSLVAAVRTSDPGGPAAIDDTTAARVGCTTAAVWRDFARFLSPGSTCRHLSVAAPFGVTYLVGLWDRPADEP